VPLLGALAVWVAVPGSCLTADIFLITFDFGAVSEAVSLDGWAELCAHAGTASIRTTPAIGAATAAIFFGRFIANSLLEFGLDDPNHFCLHRYRFHCKESERATAK
jgi:hypothetical protein